MLSILKAKFRKALAQLPFLPRALGLVWQVARPWTVAWIALLVLQGLLPVCVVYLIRPLVNALVIAIQAGGRWPAALPVMFLLGLLAASMLLMELTRAGINWVRAVQAELLRDHLTALIHEKSVTVDLAFTNSPITTTICIARAPKRCIVRWPCSEISARCCNTASRSSRWARS